MQDNKTFEKTLTDFEDPELPSRRLIAGSIVALMFTIASSIGAAWMIAASV